MGEQNRLKQVDDGFVIEEVLVNQGSTALDGERAVISLHGSAQAEWTDFFIAHAGERIELSIANLGLSMHKIAQAIQCGPRLVMRDSKGVPKNVAQLYARREHIPSDIKDTKTCRTALGINASGKIVLVVSDAPMRLSQWADTLIRIGLVEAMGLDGGGSSSCHFVQKGARNRKGRPVPTLIAAKEVVPPEQPKHVKNVTNEMVYMEYVPWSENPKHVYKTTFVEATTEEFERLLPILIFLGSGLTAGLAVSIYLRKKRGVASPEGVAQGTWYRRVYDWAIGAHWIFRPFAWFIALVIAPLYEQWKFRDVDSFIQARRCHGFLRGTRYGSSRVIGCRFGCIVRTIGKYCVRKRVIRISLWRWLKRNHLNRVKRKK